MVAVAVVEGFGLTLDRHHRVLVVGPGAVIVDRNRDGEAVGAEVFFEERVGADAIGSWTP